ncbi:MAG: HDIG domain-containing protein [Muribaculaceae bacterium]|nr:HDIG domain-containing protein [Muribaculaceae bacterium]
MKPQDLTHRHTIMIVLLLVAAVAVISVTLIRREAPKSERSYTLGHPWRHPTLYANINDVLKPIDAATEQSIEDSVRANHVPVFRRDNTLASTMIDSLDHTLAQHPEVSKTTRDIIYRNVMAAFETGIVDNDNYTRIKAGQLPQVVMHKVSSPEIKRDSTTHMRSSLTVYQHLDSLLKPIGEDHVLQDLRINGYLRPNIIYYKEKDEDFLKNEIESAMPREAFTVNEVIVEAGQTVTEKEEAYIKAYFEKLDQRNSDPNADKNPWSTKMATIALVAILLAAFFMFMRQIRPRIYHHMKKMVFLISLITLFSVAVILIVQWRPVLLYVIPFAMVPIIVSAFMDSRTAFFVHMIVVLVCSLAMTDPSDFIVLQFLAGGIATVLMKELTRRSQLVQCSLFIFITYYVGYTALEVAEGRSLMTIFTDWHMAMLFGTNCVMLSFAYFVIFIVEKIFGFTSTVTLVELCDINNRTLRELAETCPGTFQHVLQVANIAQEAAIKVDAHPQLVRAGALYHDIGKMDNPAFFTKNQSGVNPHDALAPEQSARIIIEHVTGGLRRAERARLPQVVCDMIAQHHGTGRTKYFYNKACQAAPDGTAVDAEPFTYPGPNPQTKEAAILMMADACEAAAKSLQTYSVESISTLVERIINTQVTDGLLRDAPISFRDVETVKKVFTDRLCAFYHTRISYPNEVKE